MSAIIDLEKLYIVHKRKMVDSLYSKYVLVNSPSDRNYYERFIGLLEFKNLNPYCTGKDYFKILYGDRFEWFWCTQRKKPITPYDIKYWKDKGFSQEEAIEKINIYKSNKATTLVNFIKKYGEKLGNEKYSEYTEKSKHTEEKYREKYGEDYIEKWKEYKKSKDSTSFEWSLYKCDGDIDKANILYNSRKESVKLGLEKKSKELGSLEKALEFIKKVNKSKNNGFEYYLKKNNGLYIDAINEYTDILKSRRVNFGDASKTSLAYFIPIYKYLNLNEIKNYLEIPESKPFFLYDKTNSRSYCYDFCILGEEKIIIEFNGIKWHPRLDKYTIEETSKILIYEKTEERINNKNEYDKQKEKLAKDKGYKYLIIWDEDPVEYNIEAIEKILNSNKINFKYNENDKNQISKKAKPRNVNVGS